MVRAAQGGKVFQPKKHQSVQTSLCFCHAPSFPGMFSWSGSPPCGGSQGKTMLLCPFLPRQEGKVRGWVLCGLSGRVGERQLLGRCRSEDEHDVDCAASGKGHLREALLLHEEALRVNRFHNCVDEKNYDKYNKKNARKSTRRCARFTCGACGECRDCINCIDCIDCRD